MKLTATVRFVPAYFNKRCRAHIPARWTAEVHDGLPKGVNAYSDGCQSRDEAVRDLIASLKARGFSGTLKFIN